MSSARREELQSSVQGGVVCAGVTRGSHIVQEGKQDMAQMLVAGERIDFEMGACGFSFLVASDFSLN